jgi:long-chain acyl-CoA synthetase
MTQESLVRRGQNVTGRHRCEEVRAVVFLTDGSRIDPTDLVEHCRGLIGGYKVPKMVDISYEPLPRSGTGKIAKVLLRESHL